MGLVAIGPPPVAIGPPPVGLRRNVPALGLAWAVLLPTGLPPGLVMPPRGVGGGPGRRELTVSYTIGMV